MCGFVAQLVEHRTGIAEVTGSNPVEALIFFRLLLSSCLSWKIYCDDNLFHLQRQYTYDIISYYTTQAVGGPITKISQSKCSIAGPIFSKSDRALSRMILHLCLCKSLLSLVV